MALGGHGGLCVDLTRVRSRGCRVAANLQKVQNILGGDALAQRLSHTVARDIGRIHVGEAEHL